MSKRTRLLLAIYGIFSTPLILLAFAGLFSRKIGLRIPIVSTDIIPALHRHAVWGETLKGPAILLGGEDWFFLIVAGVIFLLGIIVLIINQLIQMAEGERSRLKKAENGKEKKSNA